MSEELHLEDAVRRADVGGDAFELRQRVVVVCRPVVVVEVQDVDPVTEPVVGDATSRGGVEGVAARRRSTLPGLTELASSARFREERICYCDSDRSSDQTEAFLDE